MTDVAPAGAPKPAHFSDTERRKVVVMNIAFPVFRPDRIEPLLLRGRSESHDGDDLSLTTSEDRGTVSAGKVASLDPDRANLVGPPAVWARSILEDATAYLLLQDRLECIHNLFRDERYAVFVTRCGKV